MYPNSPRNFGKGVKLITGMFLDLENGHKKLNNNRKTN